MPGKNGTTIEIPVNLRAQVENLKQLKETLVKASNDAGKESTLGKQLQKQLQNAESMLRDLDELMISPTIDEAGFKQVQSLFDKFFKETNKAFTNIDIASFEQIATPEQIARVKEYHEEIKKLTQERERLEKHGSAERSDTYLTREGKQDVLTRGKAQKGFDPTASLGKNAEGLEKLANQYAQSIINLTETNTQLANEAVAAAAAFKTATQNVDSLKAQRDALRKDELAATFYHQMGSFDTSVPANANLRRPNIDNIRTGLRKSFNTVATDGGEIITEARDTVASWLQTTFNNVSATEATQMVNQNITTLLEQVMEKIFGDNYRNLDVSYNTDHSALLGNMQQDVRAQAEQLNRAHGTTNALELTTQRQLMDTQLKQAQEIATKAKSATDKANTKLTENQDALARLETTETNTRLLATELKELAATAREAALAANETAIALKKEEQVEYKENVVSPVKQTGAAGRVLGRTSSTSADEALGEAGGLLAAGRSAADEAKEFKEHMQQSVKHWMGAQQIVSIIKNGIRQAYQDIKNLDTAMTNIAVVTDMSISDLWGKINEYMSIAQQYGVTTQGVYEVSQLYYQQGLSTNEVMAATTETLKLARIAGMGYAEAADAMTVAIRSFKMEMSDAQHVTDVYSKVAAITASDSEELAIAMSKTASSAESVGSSFENTTAMLAVMVETTRESAQNLGSALKSIISRYGEMKVGLTVDSEGEEIDYNKVDTALKSVGISIKDAQGQFRDFDDVIFELSEKWDSLDKNTQRYIATIMAGNRQNCWRFLVSH